MSLLSAPSRAAQFFIVVVAAPPSQSANPRFKQRGTRHAHRFW
jgi:hypothetical protein